MIKYFLICLATSLFFTACTQTSAKTTTKTTSVMPTKLIYIGDPMCSWCYGFSPEFSKAVKNLGDQVEVEMVMGGLRPYNTQTMNDLKSFLTHHWEEVGQQSGQPFQYDILDSNTMLYDTEPACRAVVTVRKLKPEVALAFFKAVQTAFYAENKYPGYVETYTEIVENLGIDKEDFKKEFLSEAMKEAVKADFERSSDLGVRGFPTVILDKGEGDYVLIGNGYMKAERLEAGVQTQLQMTKNE